MLVEGLTTVTSLTRTSFQRYLETRRTRRIHTMIVIIRAVYEIDLSSPSNPAGKRFLMVSLIEETNIF
jgi:hypothetical protein